MSDHTAAAVNRILVMLRHAPHGSSWVREGLDVALVGAALGQQVSLLVTGDGVTALLKEQGAGPLGQKGTHPQFDMLEMYDVETILVDREALTCRGLAVDDLRVSVTLLSAEDIAKTLASHSLIFTF
ncbi:sulfurtransferase complex subunit TusC [Halomonas sp. WWR20]